MTTKKNQVDKLNNFLVSLGTTLELLERASDKGFFIEGFVLFASLVDGLLRMALILKSQVDEQNMKVEGSLIWQGDNDNYLSERSVYKLAYESKIIDYELYRELNDLYNKRNVVIHRFFLSGIKYSDIPKILIQYNKVYQKITKVIDGLEREQIKRGTGMTITDHPSLTREKKKEIMVKFHRDVLEKIRRRRKTPLDDFIK